MCGQRQLHQNAIHFRIGIQGVDHCQQIVLRSVAGQQVSEAFHIGGQRRLALRADIDLTGRIVAYQHNSEARLAARLPLEVSGHCADPLS